MITAQSLNNSLMSSLNQQVQAATHTWFTASSRAPWTASADDPDPNDASSPIRTTTLCSESGQAPGTFEDLLAGKSIGYKHTVQSSCPLSAADEATLASLPLSGHAAPSRPADSGGPNPPGAGAGRRPSRRTSGRWIRSAASSC